MRDNERFIIDLNKKRETAWQQLYLCGQADP